MGRRKKAGAAALWLAGLLLLSACAGLPAATPLPSAGYGYPAHSPSPAATGSGGDVCLPSAQGGIGCAVPTAAGSVETPSPWSRPPNTAQIARTAPPIARPSPVPTETPTPTPAAGSGLLAFDTQRDGNGEVYLLDVASGALTNLTRHPAEDRAPAWRPGGGALAFESHRDGNWEVYLLDLASGALARLTAHPAYDGAPAWSPDGTRLAFESYRDGNLEIYTMDAGGTDLERLTDDAAGDYGPAWSPDGASIAFTSWRDGNKEIYLAPTSGGPARNVTNHPADDEDPAWAPDGTSIALVSWRQVDEEGRRNAEIFRIAADGSREERLTDNPWPDLDPAFDEEGRLLWAAYDPGPAFETYDPYRPGDYHLYRALAAGAERLTDTDWDDRRPAPAPVRAPDAGARCSVPLLPALPATATPRPALAAGTLASVVQVPSIRAGKDGPPILLNELVVPSILAWQQDTLAATGWDFLHQTLGSWRNIDSIRKKPLYAYDYGFLSWHKTGRALDLALELKVEGVDQLVLIREDLAEGIFWRIWLRTARQDGSQGEPLKEAPWLRWWWIVPGEDPAAYEAGGKRLPIPAGYYADLTALAKRHGWERIASYQIEGDYHWTTDTNGPEYWHYERTDGLTWWQAMSQVYDSKTLHEQVGWEVGLARAQTEAMMLSKGVPPPVP